MLPVPVTATSLPSMRTVPPLPVALVASSVPAFSTRLPSSTISPPCIVSPVARMMPVLFTMRSSASLACPVVSATWAPAILPLFSMRAFRPASSTRARIRPSLVRSTATVLPAASVTVVAMICPAFWTSLPISAALPSALMMPSLRMLPLPEFVNR